MYERPVLADCSRIGVVSENLPDSLNGVPPGRSSHQAIEIAPSGLHVGLELR